MSVLKPHFVPFAVQLSTTGATPGNSIAGDYSTVPQTFEYDSAIEDGTESHIMRLVAYIRDAGAIEASGYGAGSAVANGITLTVVTSADAELYSLTPEPIKTNGDWTKYCYDSARAVWTSGDETFTARWEFSDFTRNNQGIVLNSGEKFVLTASDDFGALLEHYVAVQGYTNLTY